ncbi:MAG: hypothetical protein O7B99_14565, partial [Planctomycetota bacterium]|nr:hypothetical protein [Planctomycetota bacterium]
MFFPALLRLDVRIKKPTVCQRYEEPGEKADKRREQGNEQSVRDDASDVHFITREVVSREVAFYVGLEANPIEPDSTASSCLPLSR